MHQTASQAQGLAGGDSTSTPPESAHRVITRPKTEPMRPREQKLQGRPWSSWPAWTDQVRFRPTEEGGDIE